MFIDIMILPYHSMIRKYSQSGNVLFIILMCVGLFAALSYVVTSSMRIGKGSVSKEDAQMAASQLNQIGAAARAGLDRMIIGQDIPFSQIDFRGNDNNIIGDNTNIIVESYNANNPSCNSTNCDLFSPAGGGVILQVGPYNALNWKGFMAGQSNPQLRPNFLFARVLDVGTDKPELIMTFGSVSDEVCRTFNIINGVTKVGQPDVAGDWATTKTIAQCLPAMDDTAFPIAADNMYGDSAISGYATNPIKGQHNFCSHYQNYAWGNYLSMVLYPR